MMKFDFLVLFLTAFIPLLLGFLYYNPKVLGAKWAAAAGVNMDVKPDQKKMIRIFLITFLLSFIYAFGLQFIVIHQTHVGSILMNEVGFMEQQGTAYRTYEVFMDSYGNNFRTFSHGATHGFITSIFILLPVMAINYMFEQKSWKLIWINWGYWALCSLIMGGLICQFG